MTIYLGQVALNRMRAAKAVVDWHLSTDGETRCQRCAAGEPCAECRMALDLLARYANPPCRPADPIPQGHASTPPRRSNSPLPRGWLFVKPGHSGNTR